MVLIRRKYVCDKKTAYKVRIFFASENNKAHYKKEYRAFKQRETDNKRRKFENTIREKVKKAIWGVSYSVFDGEELLEASILSLRSCVNYVNVVYSVTSWNGTYRNDNLLEKLQRAGLIDELIEYIPDHTIAPKINEARKRNLGLEYAKAFGCTYFMTMDTDEFYIAEEVEDAKREIFTRKITKSFCSVIPYGKKSTERIIANTSYPVPFFMKVYKSLKLGYDIHSIANIDPTRGAIVRGGGRYYFLHSVSMHHMSFVRKDLDRKFSCSSSEVHAQYTSESICSNERIITVEDIFNIGDIHSK